MNSISRTIGGIFMISLPLLFQLMIPNFNFAQVNEECGFPAALQRLQRLGEVAGRPTLSGPVLNINTTNFKIHYTLSGTDATTSAWAESVAVYAEHCWSTVSNLGWALPPPDGGNGGDNRYDIYIRNTLILSPPCWGATIPEASYPTPYPDGYTSWIEIHKDSIAQPFPKWARLRALVAHEFHHACQMRYSWWEQIWFYENTSVYMEDVIYDDVNTLPYRFTVGIDPLDSPHLPITTGGPYYWYAGGIWPTFLHEYYGSAAPRRAWERMGSVAGENTLSGIDWALSNYFSSNLSSALKKYAMWRYFTGTRADAWHFSEGSTWPTSTVLRTHSSYPASGNEGSSKPSGPGGTSFIKFTNGTGFLEVSFDGQDGYTWGAYVIGYRAPSASTESEISLNSNGYGTGLEPWPGNNHIVLAPVVTEWLVSAPNLTYTYNAVSVHMKSTS